jgi:sialate O-acetylesterase
MIAPLIPYALRGVIWYQGEHNSGRGKHYEVMLTNLITVWRSKWGHDFPFYFVQLPNFTAPWENPVENGGWAEIRESFMNVAKKLPGTGMAITVDIGEADNIHPKNKQDVGKRLALLALHDIYGKTGFSRCGPVPTRCEFRGGKAIVTFDTGGSPLAIRGEGELTGFALTGMAGRTVRARAVIQGDNRVVVSSPEVPEPLVLHYAWAANPVGVNLANRDGLPATPFRFGEIPPLDCFAKMLPEEAKKWKLAYAFDPLNGRLENAGTKFVYNIDHSSRISGFRRVAYFLALQEADGNIRYAFVAMDPFTTDVSKIGVPAKGTGARFQQNVTHALVKSNVPEIATGEFPEGCNIEFWDCNYGPANAANIKNASTTIYDFGDSMNTAKSPGYGSMQIHNWQAKQCVICFNKFNAGRNADLGIGNCPDKQLDWTFSSSGRNYGRAEFKILVLP